MLTFPYNPATDIPDLSGQTILVTGGTAGLGLSTVQTLARHGPTHIIFTGRNKTAADKLIKDLKTHDAVSAKVVIDFVKCDLASLQAVAVAAKEIASLTEKIDIFMANAGIAEKQPTKTVDGYEVNMGTNHLGHALLIKLLLPTLNRAAKLSPQRPRIVFTSSLLWTVHPSGGIDFSTLHTTQRIRWPIISFFGPWIRYGQSKLANLLYAAEMARQYPQFITTSVHPGLIATNISAGHSFLDRLLLIIARTLLGIGMVVEEGIKNQLWAATAPESSVVSGEFYEPVGKIGKSDKISKSTELAKKLWDWTEEELAAYAE